MEKFKESSARIVLFRDLGILNSLTLECSFITKIIEKSNSEDIAVEDDKDRLDSKRNSEDKDQYET
jgi:hypothetical protein